MGKIVIKKDHTGEYIQGEVVEFDNPGGGGGGTAGSGLTSSDGEIKLGGEVTEDTNFVLGNHIVSYNGLGDNTAFNIGLSNTAGNNQLTVTQFPGYFQVGVTDPNATATMTITGTDLTFTPLANTSDNSAEATPASFVYTDDNGMLRTAPLTKLPRIGGDSSAINTSPDPNFGEGVAYLENTVNQDQQAILLSPYSLGLYAYAGTDGNGGWNPSIDFFKGVGPDDYEYESLRFSTTSLGQSWILGELPRISNDVMDYTFNGFYTPGLIVHARKTVTSATDDGYNGEITWDDNYIYVCIADNTWKRVAISSW